MDEFGFRGSSSDSLSVSYTPVIQSAASRRTASSRSNVSLYLSQPSRLPSPRGPNPASKPSGMHAKALSSSASVSSSGNAGLARFRSLRSMLPFGPKQSNNSTIASPSAPLPQMPANPSVASTPTQTLDLRHRRSSSSIPAPAAMANTSKQGFLSVGRRTSLSLQKEKSLPAIPSLPRSHSEDPGLHSSPVMGISRRSTSPNKVDVSNRGLPLPDDPFKKPSPNDVTTNFFQRGPSREDFGTIRSHDLSTIIESELSHLSILKRSPSPSPQGDDKRTQDDNESVNQILAQISEQEARNNNLSIMHGQDTDVKAATADLSASWEAGVAELRQSLRLHVPDDRRSGDGRVSPSTYSVSPVSAPSTAQELTPPNSLPTVSKSEIQLNSPEPEQDGRFNFDLSRVDTDFAALLKPSKCSTYVDNEIIAAVNSMEPPPAMNSSPSASPSPEPEESDRRSIVDPNDMAVSATASRRTSAQSRRRSVGMQSSPVRRSRPSSFVSSIDSLPLADRANMISADRTPVNNKTQQSRLSPTPRPDSVSPRTSHEDLTETVRRPGALGRALLSKPASSEEPSKRRVRVARLYETPSRPSTAGGVSMGRASSEGSRPFLTDAQTREDRAVNVNCTTTRSRPTTSLGMASRARNVLNADHPERPATVLSSIGRGTPPIQQRNRKRSLSASVDARPQGRAVPDWMGPRTARAFAAAGLLDADTDQVKERSAPPPVPPRADSRMRLTGSRPSLDRESVGTCSTPSLYAPSRAGFSERSIPPSAGRRRTSSRTMTISEITSARGESPVTSITSSSHARTIFSSSTATSLSCSSPHQQYQVAHLELEISSLKEKHSTEMEAILSALADSQRTSKALREENAQLRGRIRDLEEQLNDMVEQLDEARRQPPPPPTSMPSSLTRSLLRQHRSSPHESPRGSPSRNRAFVRSPVDSAASDFDMGETHTTIREHGGLLTPNFLPSSSLQSRENRPRTRASTASSIFPVLPSNMSMLLHDEGSDTSSFPSGGFGLLHSNTYASSAGSPVASPTLNVNRMATTSSMPIEKTNERSRHTTTLSLSSVEMSMLSSLPGSPKSLKLKPEHEKHLCDLKSLDFSVIDSD